MKVAIVGAGLAGLSAARFLVKQGMEVTLFEQGSIPHPLFATGDQHRRIRRAHGGTAGGAKLIDEASPAEKALILPPGSGHGHEFGAAVGFRAEDFSARRAA